ncbi:MAG: DUF4998 domain-containing protein [Tannerellaceae bacterium]|nr:DUF4998 domain-containing protein [Tannerellaceae bacterium]
MKYISFSLILWVVLLFSCDGMYDNLEKYYGEDVYPAKYDTVIGHIGYQRVEIDLLKAGRIPSGEIKMGKAKKTVIKYDDIVKEIDGLVSWVNITGLDQTKLYRFYIYTLDEYGNESVPQEIALIPFSEDDRQALVVPSPRITLSPSSAVVEWPNGLSSVLLNYISLKYEYTDKDGDVKTGEIEEGENPRFFVSNLASDTSYPVKVTYTVIPIVGDEEILDEVEFEGEITINVPSETGTFIPSEQNILTANGITDFTFGATAGITKLTYPVSASSLQDVFYFGDLEELDLTGGNLFEVETLTYSNVSTTVGGGKIQPFMRNVAPVSDTDALRDLLEAGQIKKNNLYSQLHGTG